MKLVRDVAHEEAITDWHVAMLGEPLSSGDRMKTGENSAALIKFKDKSVVRVCERSELRVHVADLGGLDARRRGKVCLALQD
jgi:hypothetical protein